MKIRREYLIFGGVIVFIIVLLITSKLVSSDSKKKDVEKYITFEEVGDDYYSDLQAEDYTNQVETELQAVDANIDVATTEEAIAEITVEQITETELTTETDDVHTEGYTELSDSELEPHLELDDDSVMTLVMYYVCNLNDDEGFAVLLTDDLVSDRANRLDSEPYKTLNGVTKLDSINKDGNFITLAVDGVTYKFECSYTEDGTRINNISYIE